MDVFEHVVSFAWTAKYKVKVSEINYQESIPV